MLQMQVELLLGPTQLCKRLCPFELHSTYCLGGSLIQLYCGLSGRTAVRFLTNFQDLCIAQLGAGNPLVLEEVLIMLAERWFAITVTFIQGWLPVASSQ